MLGPMSITSAVSTPPPAAATGLSLPSRRWQTAVEEVKAEAAGTTMGVARFMAAMLEPEVSKLSSRPET